MSSRQLAAIMFADIMGYTGLMQEDEDRAITLRVKFINILNNEVKTHHGQVLKMMGDGALCMFNSTTEAIRAAISIQQQMHNDPYVPLRIGIHSGDIITDDMDIYGDGVNIASRIESFAIPGGVFISGKAYDDIKNHKDIQTISLGKFLLKNVKDPIEIFALTNPGLSVPEKGKLEGKGSGINSVKKKNLILFSFIALLVITLAGFLTYKNWSNPIVTKTTGIKSIAVLPFRNESTAKEENEFFCNGMMGSVLNNLAQVKGLRVISRQSVEQYRGSKKSIAEIAKELGVAYILEGSVQRLNNQVKVTAQLINAKDNSHLWSQEYPGELTNIFNLQSEIAQKIAAELQVNIRPDEMKRIERIPTDNLKAWDEYQKAYIAFIRFVFSLERSDDNYQMIMTLCNRALSLDPQMAEAYTLKARTYWTNYYDLGIHQANEEFLSENSLDTVAALCKKALSIDKNSADANTSLSKYYFNMGDHETAIGLLKHAIDINPNHSEAHSQLGDIYIEAGKNPDAFRHFQQAIQLDPLSPWTPFNFIKIAWTYLAVGDFRNAEMFFMKSLKIEKNSSATVEAYTNLTHMYMVEGNGNQVLETAKKWLVLDSTALRAMGEYYYSFKKDYVKSEAYFRELFRVSPNVAHAKQRWGHVLWLMGKKDTATILFKEQIAEFQKLERFGRTFSGAFDYDFAGIYFTLGQKEKAYQHLRKFDKVGWPWGSPYLIKYDPFFDPVREDKELKEMIQRALKEKEKQRAEINEITEIN